MQNSQIQEFTSKLDLKELISQEPHKFSSTFNPINSVDRNSIFNSFIYQFSKIEFIEKIINICLFQSDLTVGVNNNADTIKFITTFLKNLNYEVSQNTFNPVDIPKPKILTAIKVAQQIATLRSEISIHLLTYDTVLQHFPKRDLIIDRLLRSVISKRLLDYQSFKKEFDEVIDSIQFFNDFRPMKKGILELGVFLQQSSSDEVSIFSLTKLYKDIITSAYNELINLKTLNKNELIEDYLCISDKKSVEKVVSNLMNFLNVGYSFYKTGYDLIDNNIFGIESSTMTLITGPSNHCKSIFMINLVRNIVTNIDNVFADGDAIVYITLEDDIHKLLRRFISIFGNTGSEIVRQLFIKANEIISVNSNNSNNSKYISDEISKILTELLNVSFIENKNNKCKIILKHCNENTFSMSDAKKFIDTLKLNSINPKILFIDYVDVMVPSSQKHSTYNDYDAQGEIIQEMRVASRNYSIPIVSITQNTRESENVMQNLSNNLVGDSYKKVRYTDYIYMIRLRSDTDLLHPQVKNDVTTPLDPQISVVDLSGQYFQNLVPLEIKITKAKDGKRNISKFHIFSGSNLRVYDKLSNFISDIPEFKRNIQKLQSNIHTLEVNSIQGPQLNDIMNNINNMEMLI